MDGVLDKDDKCPEVKVLLLIMLSW
jgi:hypothetical protein